MIKRVLYLIGVLLYNHRIFFELSNLKATEFFTDEQLDDLQTQQLRKLLRHARNNSEYYSKVLDKCDIDRFSLDDLSELPISTKTDLFEKQNYIRAKNFRSDMLIKSETSGTSGLPLVFYRDYKWDARHRAAIWRGLQQYGVHPSDYNMYVWGRIKTLKNTMKTNILDWLQNRYRIFNFDEQSIVRSLTKCRNVRYLSGYASVINSVAEAALRNNTEFKNLKLVKATSEKIYHNYAENVRKAFGVPIVSEYGAAETGIIAFDCPEGHSHVVRENVIVERLEGRILVTNLHSYSLPIIRYDLGDYIQLEKFKCDCGRHSQIISDIEGRVGKKIIGFTNKYPSLCLYYIFKELALKYNKTYIYQGVQSEPGVLELKIFQDIGVGDVELVKQIARNYLPDLDITILAQPRDQFSIKMKDFISCL